MAAQVVFGLFGEEGRRFLKRTNDKNRITVARAIKQSHYSRIKQRPSFMKFLEIMLSIGVAIFCGMFVAVVFVGILRIEVRAAMAETATTCVNEASVHK